MGGVRARQSRRGTFRAALIAAALIARPAATTLAADDEDIARRTLANADQLMREGKQDQALHDFEQVYTAWPDSPVADDALDRVASHHYPVETFDALGSVPEASLLKARDLFLRIKTKYPGEDRAPHALLKLGLIALDPANPQRNIDEAYAAFSGVLNIYPASPEVERALFGAGYADYLAGRYDKAIASFERVAEEHPRGAVADDALYQTGLAYAGQGLWLRALEQFQAVRNAGATGTQPPAGALAASALDRLTMIYRMKMQPGLSAAPLFAQDASYAPSLPAEAGRGDVSMAVDAAGGLRVLDLRTGVVTRLDHAGKVLVSAPPVPGAASLALDRAGAELIAAGGSLRAGAELISPGRVENGTLRPLTKITAAIRLNARTIALLDEERGEILLYEGDPAKLKTLYRDPTGRARLAGLSAGAAGKIYTLDRRGRRILEIAPDGAAREVVAAAGASLGLEEPVALAADDLGDLFVLDRRAAAVIIVTAEGKPVAKIASQPGGPADFSSATSLAIGSRAEIYIHDAKRRAILRYW